MIGEEPPEQNVEVLVEAPSTPRNDIMTNLHKLLLSAEPEEEQTILDAMQEIWHLRQTYMKMMRG